MDFWFIFGGGIVFTRHIIIRRHITLWLGYLESGKFKEVSKTLQHIDVLGICISMCMLLRWWRVFIHISVGFSVACSVQRQYQSLR